MTAKLLSTTTMARETDATSTSADARHADVLRVAFESPVDFADALRGGIRELGQDHPDLEFERFTIIRQEGMIATNNVSKYLLIVDVVGYHKEWHQFQAARVAYDAIGQLLGASAVAGERAPMPRRAEMTWPSRTRGPRV